MLILGLKLTHDGAIAISENNKLILSWELEKFDNNNRYKILDDLNTVFELVKFAGYNINDFNKVIVDGWVGKYEGIIKMCENQEYLLKVAPYCEEDVGPNGILKEYKFQHVKLPKYSSFMHATGHILSAYMTSPFAANSEDSFVLIWDGGMHPRLYFVKGETRHIECLGSLFYLPVNIYSIFSQHFGPFKINENVIKDELSIAGKVMAYVALGRRNDDIISDLKINYNNNIEVAIKNDFIPIFPFKFTKEFKHLTKTKDYSDEDVITSFHYFLEDLLCDSLSEKVISSRKDCANFCYAGGAALNIKWNSRVRDSKIFDNVWVPPFPNDSGSAIGAVCAGIFKDLRNTKIDWNPYLGPEIVINDNNQNWVRQDFDIYELAKLIKYGDEPVIFLNERAELGPRALGHRSILAQATNPRMKDILNKIKFREDYRPISPICLEEKINVIFKNGFKDPFMLFDHQVNSEWKDIIPSAVHIDGSARVQTVNAFQSPVIYKLLTEYYKLSGIPVLLNTSANFKGSGFFPDLNSALKWGRVNYVWCNNMLYSRYNKINFFQ
jgi:carbamoyltransferase